MTPTLLALSRAFGALPGAPKFNIDGPYMAITDGDDDGLRDYHGLLWISDPEHTPTGDPHDHGMVLDLTDPGTGGVMAAAWVADGGSVWIGPKSDGWRARPRGASILDEPTGCGATLAEAVARAAVALGRAE